MTEVDQSLSRKVKDVAAGFIGGATQVLIGQPADLVKIRLQTSASHTTTLQVIKNVLKNEGVLAFYKGTLPPLVGVGACVSLQFYGFHETKRYFQSKNKSQQINLWPQTFICGAMAGVVNTPVTSPIEQLRIISQVNDKNVKLNWTNTIKHIYDVAGIRKGIYRGWNITLLREIQAYGVWFTTYEYLISQWIHYFHYESRAQIPTWQLLVSGAIAGDALWLLSYPLDVIKSNIQSDKFEGGRFNGSALKATKYIWETSGVRGFWRGIVPCLVRAIPCSAGTFASVELALRLMG